MDVLGRRSMRRRRVCRVQHDDARNFRRVVYRYTTKIDRSPAVHRGCTVRYFWGGISETVNKQQSEQNTQHDGVLLESKRSFCIVQSGVGELLRVVLWRRWRCHVFVLLPPHRHPGGWCHRGAVALCAADAAITVLVKRRVEDLVVSRRKKKRKKHHHRI